jgi:hypothetical protein
MELVPEALGDDEMVRACGNFGSDHKNMAKFRWKYRSVRPRLIQEYNTKIDL